MIYIIVTLVIVIIVLLLEGIFECKRFRIKKYKIASDKLKGQSFKAVMIADMHNKFYGTNNIKVLNAIKNINPDVIFLAGDMLVCKENELENGKRTLGFINELGKIAHVYYSPGNHELGIKAPNEEKYDFETSKLFRKFWSEYEAGLNNNITYLENKCIQIDVKGNRLNIFGYNIPRYNYIRLSENNLERTEVEYITEKCKSDCYNIMLAHNPDFFDDYKDTGFDMVFSGHNHGGIMKIPFWRGVISPRLYVFPKYSYGIYKKNNQTMILTNGLGTHTIKIRINNVPEIVVIEYN